MDPNQVDLSDSSDDEFPAELLLRYPNPFGRRIHDILLRAKPPTIQFLRAYSDENVEAMKSLLAAHKNEINLNYHREREYPLLYRAISSAKSRVLQLAEVLLSSGADPNIFVIVDKSKRTIFQQLVHENAGNKLELVDLFLRHKADILLQDSDGKTALGIAVAQEQLDVVKVILKHAVENADSEYQKKFYRLCDLMVKDDVEGAKIFLNDIEDIQFKDMKELTPERFAIAFGKFNFIKAFIDFKNKSK